MDYIPVSMIKEYAYCPRQAYLKIMMMKEPQTESMKYAKQIQGTEDIVRIIRKHGIEGEVKLEVPVKSINLGIVGKVDAVVINGGKAIIVEAKLNPGSKRKLYTKYNHILAQVVAYSMALEESMKVTVDKVIIINQEEGKALTVKLTPNLRIWVKRIIQELRKYVQNQELPPRTVNKAKCRACYYKSICPL